MPCCYILYSPAIDKYYIGASRDDAEGRLLLHLKKKFGTDTFTAQASDWNIFLELPTLNFEQALKIEKKIKAMKSRKYIQNLRKYPEMREKIMNLYPK